MSCANSITLAVGLNTIRTCADAEEATTARNT